MNLLIAPSIRSMDLLSPSEFRKICPLAVNIFPVKFKQLPHAERERERAKRFVKKWKKPANDPVILDIVRVYKVPFILLAR